MLTVEGLSVHYGHIQALDTIALEQQEGEIVALIGGNGAGKTTLLNVISGLVRPSTGKVMFRGQDLTRLAPAKIVAQGVGQVPEGRMLFAPLTVKENLELGAYLRQRRGDRDRIAADLAYIFELFPVLQSKLAQKAGTLSGGEQQMLAIGRGLMARPRLMLLDEPSLGLAPLLVKNIMAVIQRLQSKGTTILLVEQNARAALKISDRAYVLEAGRICLCGAACDLLESDEVKQAYLGKDNGQGYTRQCRPGAALTLRKINDMDGPPGAGFE
jgi:branched-chain amino acid transport system ATP-binding protein